MAKTWFITGASAGLGREMAGQLLARGDRVVGTIRRADALADLEARHPDTLVTTMLDLTDVPGIRSAIDTAFARMGRIDVVVSNAAYGLFGAGEEVTDAQIERQIATNLVGSMQLVRAAVPHLRRQGGGRIVQVSSEGGQIAYPGFGLYHATKWGIEGFIEAVAQEVEPFGITFVIAEPGPTATQFGAGLDRASALPDYRDTPAGAVRRMIDEGTFAIRGDATRTVAAMIAAADAERPALRLALGGGAFERLRDAYRSRLAAIEAQEAVARSADRDA